MAKLAYTLKNDILFKMLFVRHPEMLRRLVSLVLDVPLENIQEFLITNTEIPPEVVGSKFCRLDINMVVGERHIDLEVQVNDEGDYIERATYYGARELSTALKTGMQYNQIPQAIIISIVDFIIWDHTVVHTVHHVHESTLGYRTTDILEWHYFELPKLSGRQANPDDELDVWLKLFDANTEEELMKLEDLEVPAVKQAISAYRNITATEEFQYLARIREDALHNEESALAHAREQGRNEQKRTFAVMLLRERRPLDEVARYTGMPLDELDMLRRTLLL